MAGRRGLDRQGQTLAMLQYLMDRTQAVVSRDELREAVWGKKHGSQHGPKQCIHKLRVLLDDTADAPRFIETVGRHGYARVSSEVQTLALQRAALLAAGVTRLHTDEGVSGAAVKWTGLDAVLGGLVQGDVLVVWKLDRLGRSLSHLIHVVAGLADRGVGFRSLTETIDTTTRPRRRASCCSTSWGVGRVRAIVGGEGGLNHVVRDRSGKSDNAHPISTPSAFSCTGASDDVRHKPRLPCLAGPIAEQRLRPDAVDLGDDTDIAMAVTFSRRITNGDLQRAEHVMDELTEFATGLVVCYSSAIQGTARALLQYDRLDGDIACRQASGIWRPISTSSLTKRVMYRRH